jgi:hypothetical protein
MVKMGCENAKLFFSSAKYLITFFLYHLNSKRTGTTHGKGNTATVDFVEIIH